MSNIASNIARTRPPSCFLFVSLVSLSLLFTTDRAINLIFFVIARVSALDAATSSSPCGAQAIKTTCLTFASLVGMETAFARRSAFATRLTALAAQTAGDSSFAQSHTLNELLVLPASTLILRHTLNGDELEGIIFSRDFDPKSG